MRSFGAKVPFFLRGGDRDLDRAGTSELEDSERDRDGEALRLRLAGGDRLRSGDCRLVRFGDGERRLRGGEGDLRRLSSSLPFLRSLRRSRERDRDRSRLLLYRLLRRGGLRDGSEDVLRRLRLGGVGDLLDEGDRRRLGGLSLDLSLLGT